MNKSFFTLLIILTATTVFAQDISNHAIGLRFGGGNGFGTEVSYQKSLGDNNRLEADLGLQSGDKYSGFQLTGIYQWIWDLEGNFNWYAGAGAGLANRSYDNDFPGLKDGDDSETFLFVAGQVGIEYIFDEIPLQLSIDTRPQLGFSEYGDDLDFDLALGIRYLF